MMDQGGPPNLPARSSSLRYRDGSSSPEKEEGLDFHRDIRLYQGLSGRERGWRCRNSKNQPLNMRPTSNDINIMRWDGALKSSTQWDSLRKDTELWFPEGDCLVHLYAFGQSQRGPAFRIPFDALLSNNCQPFIDRFLYQESMDSLASSNIELYIPASTTTAQGDAFIHYMAIRNFLAWMFGEPLVGTHLGGALVSLLNCMEEWRSEDQENAQDVMDYMDSEGYTDMRSSPDHALGILFFAEHFRFKDLYIDAFTHCTGMYDELIYSPGYEPMSRLTRALISRSKVEMDLKLDSCGTKISSFLQDDLSDLHLELSAGSRAHLDNFRSFLQVYYVAKFGYYPPTSTSSNTASLPKHVYAQMLSDLEQLYDFLADTQSSSADIDYGSDKDGISVSKVILAYDMRNRYSPLPHALPLLPDAEDTTTATKRTSWRMGWIPTKIDKMKPDPRLVAFSALSKATNRGDSDLYDCSLVRAYRNFEKECVFSTSKADRSDKISYTEARKVRWIVIYTILQTLLSATKAPQQVRDTHNVPYDICVQAGGLPPWNDRLTRPHKRPQRRPQGLKENLLPSIRVSVLEGSSENMLDMNIIATGAKPIHSTSTASILPSQYKPARPHSIASLPSPPSLTRSKKGSVKRALSSLGRMPELVHPKPCRLYCHEILIAGYGNETNISSPFTPSHRTLIREEEEEGELEPRMLSSGSGYSAGEERSSRWSSSDVAQEPETPGSSVSSIRSGNESKKSVKDFMDGMTTTGLALRRMSSASSVYSVQSVLQLHPSQVRGSSDNLAQMIQGVAIGWNREVDEEETTDGLLEYLANSCPLATF